MKKAQNTLDSQTLLRLSNVSMFFNVPEYKFDTLKERVTNIFKGRRNHHRKIQVLEDISFEIKRGESLGVIGHNGAGKSTLLKIASGIYKPSSGKVESQGKIVLLNIGTGFDYEADAEENIYLNGAILGFSKKQIKERFDSIIDFAELREFIKLPLKNYSSGMVSRLGFAIAIDVHPDLLLIDEVLSVGDTNFQMKCMSKIMELKNSGVSFLFVSHNIGQVKELCSKTIWIENSKVVDYGPSDIVCDKYIKYCEENQK